MYNFNNFIEILNNFEDGRDYFGEAVSLIKDDFHVGKIEAKSNKDPEILEYYVTQNIVKQVFRSYSKNGLDYNFYRANDGYEYSEEEIKDIDSLLRILSLCYKNYNLIVKAEEAKLYSFNTKLFNVQGYIKEINKKSHFINLMDYNSYYFNIKAFGLINKLYSSERGDKAIIAYANKLKQFIADDEILGHLGGDNFVALIKKTRHDDFIKLLTSAEIEINFNDTNITINLTSVVGYFKIDKNENDYSELISYPSMACQYARSIKKLQMELTPDLIEMLNSIKNVESTFKEELAKGNFIVYYQPKFDINTGKIIGVEALSRWINNGKVVPPVMFVPVLEKNGDIINLDLHVLENLCHDIHNYRNMGHNIVPASCNLSRRDFEHDDLEQRVINIIKKYNVKTEDIVIEVTETTNLEEKERLARFIDTMNENGILTSIDDFGTGYSSLSVLRDFKVSEIKIDRSFINREHLSDSDKIIIGSIIDMAKRLKMEVICEGVETDKQARFLLDLGCNKAQGYLFSKPVPKLEFESMLQKIGTYHDK